jgi:hypothetical protein
MQFPAERIDVAGRVEDQKNQHGDRNQHEDSDSQLAQGYISL